MLENFIMQVRRLKGVSSERVAFVSRSGVLIFQHSMILIYNVYGTIDNKNVRRNRIGQNLGKDNGSMVCRTKLLSQLGVTAPIESLHNLIETLKSDRPRHFVTFLRNQWRYRLDLLSCSQKQHVPHACQISSLQLWSVPQSTLDKQTNKNKKSLSFNI